MAELFSLPTGAYTRGRRAKPTNTEMLDALHALEEAQRELTLKPGGRFDRLEALRQVERALVIVNRATS